MSDFQVIFITFMFFETLWLRDPSSSIKLCRPGPATLLVLTENVAELTTPNISSIIHSG